MGEIRIKVSLKNEMKTNDITKWLCTINGERRVVTSKVLHWHCNTLEEAANSIVEEELDWFEIRGGHLDKF